MKKILLVAALTVASASAFASKARLDALQNAPHLTDVQNTFSSPWQMMTSGEMATFEFGATGGTPRAEGGFVRSMGDSYLGFYLGHASDTFLTAAGKVATAAGWTGTAADFFAVNNPMNIWYGAKAGDMTWGVNFAYLSSDVKSAKTAGVAASKRKASVMGLSAGATNGVWDASLSFGLAGKGNATVSGADIEMTSKSSIGLKGGYAMGSLYYFGSYTMSGAKAAVAGTDTADADHSDIVLGVANDHKKDGTDFFYGVYYNMTTDKEKFADTKTETSMLPVIIGVEAEAASWLTFRASVTQNVLLGSTKTTTAGNGDADSIPDSTTVAAGVGMKWNKFVFDGVLKTATSGNFGLDSAGFLSNASFTYMF